MEAPTGIRIVHIKQLYSRIFERLLRRHTSWNISGSQYNILFQLWMEDNITISELSRRTQLTNATLTSMLDRLEAQQLLLRKQNPENRREIRVLLTDAARQMRQEYEDCCREMTAIPFKGFTAREQHQFELYLERLYQNLLDYELQQKQMDNDPGKE